MNQQYVFEGCSNVRDSSEQQLVESPLTESETRFLSALEENGVRVILVGLSAAVLQGADVVTQDLDLWFESISHPEILKAAKSAGGFFSTRAQPPILGGPDMDRFYVVTHCDGLGSFQEEFSACSLIQLGSVQLPTLPLDRVIQSKTVANRPKDRAVLEQLRAASVARK